MLSFDAAAAVQGDCHARLGNAEQAAASYQASIAYLESCPTKAIEVGSTSEILHVIGTMTHLLESQRSRQETA